MINFLQPNFLNGKMFNRINFLLINFLFSLAIKFLSTISFRLRKFWGKNCVSLAKRLLQTTIVKPSLSETDRLLKMDFVLLGLVNNPESFLFCLFVIKWPLQVKQLQWMVVFCISCFTLPFDQFTHLFGGTLILVQRRSFNSYFVLFFFEGFYFYVYKVKQMRNFSFRTPRQTHVLFFHLFICYLWVI